MICPYCKNIIKGKEEKVVCFRCETQHHKKCWDEHQGCSTEDCYENPLIKFQAENVGNKTLPENDPNYHQPTLDKILRDLNLYFELATFYTMVAGLLNVLAIYDALSGPVVSIPVKKEERPDKSEKTEKS